MENNKQNNIIPAISDGNRIKKALVDFLSKSAEEDIFSLKDTVESVEPEIDGAGILRIGPWTYDAEKNAMTNYLPPLGPVGYDYRAYLTKEGDDWRVDRLQRIEVFMR